MARIRSAVSRAAGAGSKAASDTATTRLPARSKPGGFAKAGITDDDRDDVAGDSIVGGPDR